VVYRSLKSHLQLACLEGLINSQSLDSNSSLAAASAAEQVINHWSVLCDVNLCLEATVTAASPTGYAIDAMREGVIILPTPAPSTASILPLEKFSFVAIPYRNEYMPLDRGVIPLPAPHREALQHRKKKALSVQRQLQELISESSSSLPDGGSQAKAPPADSKDKVFDNLGSITAISPVLSKKFTVSLSGLLDLDFMLD
jgi:hypothetical protein